MRRTYDKLENIGVLAVHDPRDPTAAPEETRQKARATSQESVLSLRRQRETDARSLCGLRIGIPKV
jgi:hypothetical protein